MKENNITEEFMNPYVRLERCSTEGIIRPNLETNEDYSSDSNTENDEFGALNNEHHLFDDFKGKIFRSYVLLERLSPCDIKNLSNKKD